MSKVFYFGISMFLLGIVLHASCILVLKSDAATLRTDQDLSSGAGTAEDLSGCANFNCIVRGRHNSAPVFRPIT